MKDQRLYVRVPQELLEQFDDACFGLAGTRSDHIRRAMVQYIKHVKRMKAAYKMDVQEEALVS